MRKNGFRWIKARAHVMAERFDAVRIDHVVGLFRQYVRPTGVQVPSGDTKLPEGVFDPADETEQAALGEELLLVFIDEARRTNSGLQVVAEDLGIIPPFVEITAAPVSSRIQGSPVGALRRRVPRSKKVSCRSRSCWSTHDTSPITKWWGELEPWEQEGMRPFMQFEGTPLEIQEIATLFSAGSDLALLTLPELLNEPSRINTPGTIGPHNWTYRMSTTIEGLDDDESTKSFLRRASTAHGRAASPEPAE